MDNNSTIIGLLLVILGGVAYQIISTRRPMRKAVSKQLIFVDTSVLIDGRIVSVAESGVLTSTLVIPRSVVAELQLLADGGDGDKRARARHGLDVVAELQALATVNVEILADGRADEGVDDRLLSLAKQHSGILCTIDYNLNKVAQVEGVPVININELAKGLRIAYLPGERLQLALTTKGNDKTQAVGHLEDGTMVVVEQAKSHIGTVVEIEIIRSLQTAAGRMMFARLVPQVKEKKAPTGESSAVARKRTIVKPSGTKKTQIGSTSAATALQAKHHNKQQPVRRQRQTPKSNEDRLIDLVNEQE